MEKSLEKEKSLFEKNVSDKSMTFTTVNRRLTFREKAGKSLEKINGVSVVIPVYNEEKTLANTLVQMKKVMDSLQVDYEIIGVDDCSKDNSLQVLKKHKFVRALHHPMNKGYSSAIKTGIKNSRYDWVMIIDADGTYPVDAIPLLVRYIPDYDMVVGARTGENVSIPLMRKPAKMILGGMANFLSGYKIPDVNSGLRIFRKELALHFYHLFPQRFSFTITITLAFLTNGYSVKYIAINYYKREEKSTIHPVKDFLKFLAIIFRIIVNFKPLKVFGLVSAALFLAGMGVAAYSLIFLHQLQLDVTVLLLVIAAMQTLMFGVLADLIARNNNRLR